MGLDLLNLQKALDKFNDETLPRIEQLINNDLKILVDEIHSLLDRLDGTRIKIDIPPRGAGSAGN